MPTGTRSSISAKSTMKPRTATASALIATRSFDGLDRIARHEFGMEDQTPGAHRDQKHGRHVPGPGDGEERPGRQMQIVGQNIVESRPRDFIEKHDRLHRDHEKKNERGEYVDGAFVFRR